jgi:predicted nucleic acid-binding protein
VIVADTNVVSESMSEAPDPTVLAWAQGIDPGDLTICVVTVEEIERGLGRLPDGRRRRDLDQRWRRLMEVYADAIAVYDLPAAQHTASILVASEAAGRPMSLADAQIAGICRAGGYELATRNLNDFASTGLTIINPFT